MEGCLMEECEEEEEEEGKGEFGGEAEAVRHLSLFDCLMAV